MYKDKYMYAYFNMAYAEFEQIPPVTNPLVSKDSALALTVINAADTSRYWKGELDYTSPNVDLQTGTVTVRAILENPKEELLSGMYVKIRLPYKVVKDALLIPEARNLFELGISHIEISIHILIFIHRSQGDRLYRSSDKVLKVHQVPGYPSVERSFDVTIIQIGLSSIQLCPGILKIRYRRMVIRFGLDEVDLTDSPARHRFFHLLVLCPGESRRASVLFISACAAFN